MTSPKGGYILSPRPTPGKHVVARVDFGLAPCWCSCGWAGLADDFAEHRRDMGQDHDHESYLQRQKRRQPA